MNALFLKDLADKTRRGLEGRARQGRSGGGLCYGYDIVRERDANGEPIYGGRKINQAEAGVVRRIFVEFATGKSPRRIAVTLNREGVRGPRCGQWDASTINGNAARGTGALNNELYAGRLVWNRLRYVKDPATGKRVSRLNEPDRWIVQPVPELQVVALDLWDAVKARQQAIKRDTRPEIREKPFWARQRPRFFDHRPGKMRGLWRQLHQDQRSAVRLRRGTQPRHLRQPAQHSSRRPRRHHSRRPAPPIDAARLVQGVL